MPKSCHRGSLFRVFCSVMRTTVTYFARFMSQWLMVTSFDRFMSQWLIMVCFVRFMLQSLIMVCFVWFMSQRLMEVDESTYMGDDCRGVHDNES